MNILGSGLMAFERKEPVPQKKPLNDLSWAEIQTVIDAGKAAEYWSVGDTKDVVLNGVIEGLAFTNETYKCFIIGIDHNEDLEGKGVHFQFGKSADGNKNISFGNNLYATSGSRFSYHTENAAVGWSGCYMRNTICPQFLNILPTDLRAVIQPCTKYTDNVGNGQYVESYVTPTQDNLFLLSDFEVFGQGTFSNPAEPTHQQQYDYYKNGNLPLIYQHDDLSNTVGTILRTPTNEINYCRSADVQNGVLFSNRAEKRRSYGFAPAFRIGPDSTPEENNQKQKGGSISPELLVLVPVLYLIGMGLKRTQRIEDGVIPLCLGVLGMLLAALYTLATGEFLDGKGVLQGLFAGVTQGVLCAGASVYVNQLIKQAGKGR